MRTLAKAPLFTGVAVLSLALGIGANTALFGLAHQILLRLLPVKSPRELVQLKVEGGRFGSNNGDGVGTFSHPLYLGSATATPSSPAGHGLRRGAQAAGLFGSLIEGLATVPGVKAVGANSSRLLMGGRWDSNVTIPGVRAQGGTYPWSYFNAVTPGYFEALRIPNKAGRDFTWNDWGAAQERCLVNEALVTEYLRGENPVGRRMAQGRETAPNMEMIGVFGNASYDAVRGTVPCQTFVSMGGSRIRKSGRVRVQCRGAARCFTGRRLRAGLARSEGRSDPGATLRVRSGA